MFRRPGVRVRCRPARARAASAAVAVAVIASGVALVAPAAQAEPGQQAPRAASSSPSHASTFQSVGTAVAYDSTAGDGPIQAGEKRGLALTGLPDTAHRALVLLTAHDVTARGRITVRSGPTGGAIAKLRFPAQGSRSTIQLVPVAGGQMFVKAAKRSAVDVKVNLLGYDVGAIPATAKGRPAVAVSHGAWAAGATQSVRLAHRYGTPGRKKLVAALLRITTRRAAAAGGIQVAPTDATSSAVAPILPGQKTSTIALVPTAPTGDLELAATVDAHVRVELIGYVADSDGPTPSAPSPAGSAAGAPAPQEVAPAGAAAVAVQYALSKVGDRYVAGAAGPDAFDCSGLTMAAWAAAGVSLAHLSYSQFDQTQHISLGDIQPGDLLFYLGSGVHHVTIYVGNGQMVNAANPGAGVVLSSVDEPWDVQHLTGVGRVIAAPDLTDTPPS